MIIKKNRNEGNLKNRINKFFKTFFLCISSCLLLFCILAVFGAVGCTNKNKEYYLPEYTGFIDD